MKKLILVMMLTVGLANATDINQQYTNIHPKQRTFKSVKEFKKTTNKRVNHTDKKIKISHPYEQRVGKYYNHNTHRHHNNSSYMQDRYYHPKPQRGYRHPQRSWFYAYRYTKADFVDRYGFYYGYFDRRGYMFEGEFYRYDRDYRYQDRLRGRGLFDRHYFYRPLPRIYRDDLYR